MKSFICLAISCLLIGLLYVYMRQQFAAQNLQIQNIKEMISSMAEEMGKQEEPKQPPKQISAERHPRVPVSDDSESEDSSSEEESDEESSEDESVVYKDLGLQVHVEHLDHEELKVVQLEKEEETEKEEQKQHVIKLERQQELQLEQEVNMEVLSFDKHEVVSFDNQVLPFDKLEVDISISNDGVKTVTLEENEKEVNYEKMTVKDLKKMANELGQTALKTKSELVEFFKKK